MSTSNGNVKKKNVVKKLSGSDSSVNKGGSRSERSESGKQAVTFVQFLVLGRLLLFSVVQRRNVRASRRRLSRH